MNSVVSAGAYLGKLAPALSVRQTVRGFVNPIRHLKPTDGRRWRPALGSTAADCPPSQVSHKDLAAGRYKGEWRFQAA